MRVFYALHEDFRENCARSRVDPRTRTARLLGVSARTASTITTEWSKLSRKDDCTDEELKRVLEPNLRSGYASRNPTSITDSKKLLYDIQDFMLHRRVTVARVSAPEVPSFLKKQTN